MSKNHYQILVIGSGFGGSLIAMIARQLGFSTALIERGRHPRFAIGESSTPLANLLLEEITVNYDLPFIRPLTKWGVWQKELPQLACGLKRGFTFYHHEFDQPFAPDPERRRQLLVGANPRDEIADTHWYRPDFDHYLVQQAQILGVDYLDETTVTSAAPHPEGMRLTGKRHGRPFEITGEFVIDASGPRGCLWRTLKLKETEFDSMPRTQALFSHFRNVETLPKAFFCDGRISPYPPEQAAVHHVFPGGWIWVLKFNNGITSAGVAATAAVANDLDFRSGEAAWQKLLRRLPSVGEIFGQAQTVLPFVHLPQLSFRSSNAAGAQWALLPSAAGFVDPLLSTGFPLTLLGVTRMANLLKHHWRKSSFRPQLEDYSQLTLLELDAAARMVSALYVTMGRFDLFREMSLLYFAAASYSEAARRLGKSHLADSFLLCRNPVFSKQFRLLCELASQPQPTGSALLRQQVRTAIKPIDVAGLTDEARHPWYPASASDVLRNAAKLEAGEQEVRAMLLKCGITLD